MVRGERVALYEGTIDPWNFTQLPDKKQPIAA